MRSVSIQKSILQGCVVWLAACFLLSRFWDSWTLDGPHGAYCWVGMDFVPFWVGVQEMRQGFSPYTPEVTLKIQEVLYGGPAGAYDPMMFVYPAWLFIVILPFSLLPLKWAAILYSSTLFLFLCSENSGCSLGWGEKHLVSAMLFGGSTTICTDLRGEGTIRISQPAWIVLLPSSAEGQAAMGRYRPRFGADQTNGSLPSCTGVLALVAV